MVKVNDIVRTTLKRNAYSVKGMHGNVVAIRGGNAIHPDGLALVRLMGTNHKVWLDIAKLTPIDWLND
jgi:hypothetical protein|tara:strand:- start:500 stop:703 length:204 start_codon:yes stop_codon:yes gene_type:complete